MAMPLFDLGNHGYPLPLKKKGNGCGQYSPPQNCESLKKLPVPNMRDVIASHLISTIKNISKKNKVDEKTIQKKPERLIIISI